MGNRCHVTHDELVYTLIFFFIILVIFPDGFHKVIESFMVRCPKVLRDSSMIRFNDHHISLSRTVPVQYHWIQPLTTSLMESINNHNRYGNINSTQNVISMYVHVQRETKFTY